MAIDQWSSAALRGKGLCSGFRLLSGVEGVGQEEAEEGTLTWLGIKMAWESVQVARRVWRVLLNGHTFGAEGARVMGIVSREDAEMWLGGQQAVEHWIVRCNELGMVWWEASSVEAGWSKVQAIAVEVWDGARVVFRWQLECTGASSEEEGEQDVRTIIQQALEPVAYSLDDLSRRLQTVSNTVSGLHSTVSDHEDRVADLEAGGGGGGGGGGIGGHNTELTGLTSMESAEVSGAIVQVGNYGTNSARMRNGSFSGHTSTSRLIVLCNCTDSTLTYFVSAKVLFIGNNGSGGSDGLTRDMMAFRCLVRGGASSEVAYIIDDIDLTSDGDQILIDETTPLLVNGDGELQFKFTTAGGSSVTYRYQVFAEISTIAWS